MEIVYFSKTNNIERFVKKIKYQATKGNPELVQSKPFILLIYTSGFGEVPNEVQGFMNIEKNKKNIKGVVCSGNKNWGEFYCKAGDTIAKTYNVPMLLKFELSGNKYDVERFNEIMKNKGGIENESI